MRSQPCFTEFTWCDPIVDEVRRTRDAYAARFHYDLRAIYRDLKEQEKRSGRKIVSYAKEPAPIAPNQALPPGADTAGAVPDNVPSQQPGPAAGL